MSKIYFNQADKRWANHPYPSSAHPNATIKSGGCGATSGAMIVSSFKQTIYPNQMGDMFIANGFRAAQGTSASAFPWLAKKYNLKMKRTIYINDAVDCLKRGGMCIAHLYDPNNSLFSTGGHYVVLADIRGNNLVVYDPYLYAGKFKNGKRKCVKVNGIECIVSINNFKRYDNYNLYCYEYPDNYKPQEKSKYEIGQWVEIDVPIAKTGAMEASTIGGNDILVDDLQGTPNSQYWIHESVVDDRNHIHARALICFVQDKSYMVQVFNRQFWVNENNIVKKLD